MTTIKLKFKDLNLRLAEKSAIYLTEKRHTKDGEIPCFPDLLRTPDSQLKKLYEIGLSKSLFIALTQRYRRGMTFTTFAVGTAQRGGTMWVITM